MCNVFAIQNAPFLSLWQFATALSYAGNWVLNKRTWIFLTLRSTRYITNPGITNAGIYIYIYFGIVQSFLRRERGLKHRKMKNRNCANSRNVDAEQPGLLGWGMVGLASWK